MPPIDSAVQELVKEWGGAVVERPEDRRTAIFVYAFDDRIVWIEPAYLDPYNAAPAMREHQGKVTIEGDRVRCGDITLHGSFTAEEDSALAFGHFEIHKRGRTYAEERELQAPE